MLIKELPKSNATTVRELLNDVKQALLEEPKRANMGRFVASRDRSDGSYDYPSCGTVGCFAGWIGILAGVSPDNRALGNSADRVAMDILGWDLGYVFRGRNRYNEAQNYGYFNSGEGDGLEGMVDKGQPKRGTRAYARLVIKRVNRFMQQNADKLDRPFNRPEQMIERTR